MMEIFKKTLILIISIIISFGLWYLTGSISMGDFNICNWEMPIRVSVAMASLITLIGLFDYLKK